MKGTGFKNVALLALRPDLLVVGTWGELAGLDPLTGTERWKNGLKGLG